MYTLNKVYCRNNGIQELLRTYFNKDLNVLRAD